MSEEYAESLKRLSAEVNRVTTKKSSSLISIDFDKFATSPYMYGVISIIIILLLIMIKPKMITYQANKYQRKVSVGQLIKYTIIFSIPLWIAFFLWNRRKRNSQHSI